MARYEHIRIFQLSYDITVKTYKITANFKKEYKYTLGEKLKLLCHEMLDLIVEANSSKDKKELLEKLNFKMESLRIYFRVASDLKLIGAGLLGEMNKLFNEVGQQVAGWQKWAEQNVQSTPARVLGGGQTHQGERR
jgi:hypothetical protein